MNTSKEHIIAAIKEVLESVDSIKYAFLFGSALGRMLPGSDIDVLVGGLVTFEERLAVASALSRRLQRTIDLVPVNEARSDLVMKAMSEGVLVFVNDGESLKQDYLKNWRRSDDSTRLKKIKIDRIKSQYVYGG